MTRPPAASTASDTACPTSPGVERRRPLGAEPLQRVAELRVAHHGAGRRRQPSTRWLAAATGSGAGSAPSARTSPPARSVIRTPSRASAAAGAASSASGIVPNRSTAAATPAGTPYTAQEARRRRRPGARRRRRPRCRAAGPGRPGRRRAPGAVTKKSSSIGSAVRRRDHEVAAAAQPGHHRLDHDRGQHRGHRRVHRVAAGAQHVGARPPRSAGAPPPPPHPRRAPSVPESQDSRARARPPGRPPADRPGTPVLPPVGARGTLGAGDPADGTPRMATARAARPLSTAEAVLVATLAYLVLLISLTGARIARESDADARHRGAPPVAAGSPRSQPAAAARAAAGADLRRPDHGPVLVRGRARRGRAARLRPAGGADRAALGRGGQRRAHPAAVRRPDPPGGPVRGAGPAAVRRDRRRGQRHATPTGRSPRPSGRPAWTSSSSGTGSSPTRRW